MITITKTTGLGSCNFCTAGTDIYELRSTNQHRNTVIYICDICFNKLGGAVINAKWGYATINAAFVIPHCDARILHAKGACEYCDNSNLQSIREAWNIAFTGKPEEGKTQCPAEAARSEESLASWGGNVPRPTLESVAKHLEEKDEEEGQGGST